MDLLKETLLVFLRRLFVVLREVDLLELQIEIAVLRSNAILVNTF